jgi:hypothetical protein
MNCDQARLLLPFARAQANELDAADQDALNIHLSACGSCGPYARGQHALDARLAQAMKAVPVPVGLRERLLTRLGNERGAYYRTWLLRGVAAAAAVVLVFAAIAYFRPSPPASLLDPRELAGRIDSPRSFDPGSVNEWMSNYKVQMPAELRDGWDFQYVTAAYVTRYGGRDVPTLEFRKGDTFAVVLVVRRRDCEPHGLSTFEHPQYRGRVLGKDDPGEYVALVIEKQGQGHEVFRKPTRITA